MSKETLSIANQSQKAFDEWFSSRWTGSEPMPMIKTAFLAGRKTADTRKATLDTIKEMRDDRIKRANAVWDNPIGHSAALNELQRQLKFGASIIDEVINKLEGNE